MRELLSWIGYAVFLALGLFGTALAVGWICVVVDPAPAPAPASIEAESLGQLRRRSALWAGLMVVWLAAVWLLARL